MTSLLIITCPSCNGRWNGRNITHTHIGGEQVDDRFLNCACKGRGAVTCETCGGDGRVVVENGVIVGTHKKPATMNILGPRKGKGQ